MLHAVKDKTLGRMSRSTRRMPLALTGALIVVGALFAAPTASATQPYFEAGAYPAEVETLAPQSDHTFDFQSVDITCDLASLEGEVSGDTDTLDLAPSYSGCTNGSDSWVVEMNGCTYEFSVVGAFSVPPSWPGQHDIVCPQGEKMLLRGPFGICKVEIPAQTGINVLVHTNKTVYQVDYVETDIRLTDFEYTEVDTAFCPFTETATRYDGEYTGLAPLFAEHDSSYTDFQVVE
jgi:hypothetical protein